MEAVSAGKLKDIGDRGYNVERMYNVERGIRAKDDSLPERLSPIPLEELKKKYYEVRGWDANGIPKEDKLKRLKLIE